MAAIAWVFARSLWSPRGALISRIVAALEGGTPATLAPELLAYSRGLTAAWAVALAVLGLANLALAMVASPGGLLAGLGLQPPLTITREQWSLFANVLNYGLVGGFFLWNSPIASAGSPPIHQPCRFPAPDACSPGVWRDSP